MNAEAVNRVLGTNLKSGDKVALTANQFAKVPTGSLVGFQAPKTSTIKQMGAGDAINYMTEIQATRYLLNKGLSRDNPNFENIRDRLVTQDENLLGTPLIISGKPAEINFTSKDGEIIDAVISQIKGSDKTDYASYKTKKLQEIAGIQLKEARVFDSTEEMLQWIVQSLNQALKDYEGGADVYYVLDDIEELAWAIQNAQVGR